MVMVVIRGMCVQSIMAILYVLLSATYRSSLRLLVVGGEHIAMAMVVGHICTQNIMVVHNTIY